MSSSNDKIGKIELASYFGYGVGQCLSFGLIGSFILFFYTEYLGISAIAASTIFLIARIWDAVNDPIIAGYMDTLNSKHGKFRPYMLYMPVVIALVTVLCFWNIDAPMWAKIAYAAVTYIIWGTIYTISDVPFWSVASVMSRSPQQRATAVTAAAIAVGIGVNGANIVFPKLAALFAEGSTDGGYTMGASILMIAGLVLMLNGFFNTKERVDSQQEKVTLKDTFRTALQNKPLRIVLLAYSTWVFYNIANGLYVFFFTYNIGDIGMLAALGTIGIVTGFSGMLTPVLTKRFQKRTLIMAISGLEIITRVTMYSFGYDSPVLLLTMFGIANVFSSIIGPLLSATIIDTIEYGEYKTGKRCAAITFSGQTFTGKLAVAIAGGLTGLFLTFIGYVPNSEQTQEALDGLFFAVVLLPAIGAFIRLAVMSRYTFTEDKHAEVCAELEKRNNQQLSNGNGQLEPATI
ncbi:Sodium:galactoside symporter [Vibrio aestuarianus]|uniref:Sodium:galactoside symporter n=1 Tax=Vibrio aestuarianus TaxID=28171 RepID=A0ABM9FSD9_9VIBR|nr:MFS transporter [Vibrio aestuarianus]MDE1257383.1 MFS transporter [Vibrio aestuarianus]NLS58738.1 MFS transporter [Vibrio aestuarianus subsp. francensis]CAH8203296.1 Sodium:galactoside symporter [Vibrio aestuarianus]CAH8237988.1 Sodium:galactoside symporter [Vibrio aestuarianus]